MLTLQAAGGHFNPDGVDHSSPLSPSRHAGDLGNILADGPNTVLNMVDSYISLGDGGLRDVAGRSVIVALHCSGDWGIFYLVLLILDMTQSNST